jgi:SAM-dependent methyltransferase
LLYLLGLSYGAVSLALDALGVYVCKSRVYDAVQAAAERVPGMKRDQVFENVRTPALGDDLTSVKVKGQWHTLGLTVDDTTGLVLTVEGLSGEDAAGLDPDQSSLHEHRALALRLACGLAEALPYADGSFDLLCCSWVLEHLPDPAHAFTEVVRVLAPGGHFVFLTPNRRHPLLLLNRALGWTQGRLVGRFYDRAEADTFPAFYRANTPAQIERLARATRLTRVSLRFVGDPTYLAFSTSHCSGWPACWSTSHRARCGCTWRGSTCRCSVAVANSMPQPVIL